MIDRPYHNQEIENDALNTFIPHPRGIPCPDGSKYERFRV